MTPALMDAIIAWFGTYPWVVAALNGSAAGPAEEPTGTIEPDARVFFEEPDGELRIPCLVFHDLSPVARQNANEDCAHYKGTVRFAGLADTPKHAWYIADSVRRMMDGGGIDWPDTTAPKEPKLKGFYIAEAPGVTWNPEHGCWQADGRIAFETQRVDPYR